MMVASAKKNVFDDRWLVSRMLAVTSPVIKDTFSKDMTMPIFRQLIWPFYFLLILLPAISAGQGEDRTKREAYLREIIRLQEHPSSADSFVSYHDKTWLEWQRRTGELPPDFDALPSLPFLPDLLTLDEGRKNIPVTSAAQWQQQRQYFREQVRHLFSGTFPDPPGNVRAKILDERTENGVKIQRIELTFGNDQRGRLSLEVFTPPGRGPFPVFMSQWNHRAWAQIAVRRGYMGLIYAGADIKDDTRAYLALYPEHDWTTLMTRAWGAHRAVDYLYTLDNVDRTRIAITGHSRNGKQSLLAAAFDERITAVISSSAGTGGEIPYRYTDERFSNESIEFLYSRRTHWAHPRLRFYVGREHKMPIDQTSLMALIAPNALLLSSSIREEDGDPWAIEQAYRSLAKVYKFLNVPDKLGVRFRDGEHPVEARDIEAYLDWLDIQFNRKLFPWKNTLYYDYSFDQWKALSKERVDVKRFPVAGESLIKAPGTAAQWKNKRSEMVAKVRWLLGDEPPGIKAEAVRDMNGRSDYLVSFMNRPRVKNGKEIRIAPYNPMGDNLHASLYCPTDAEGKTISGRLPVVIFLHKFSNTGFNSDLSRLFDAILATGSAVLAFDLIGYGTRIEEGAYFYQRYPHWSKLGKMVSDTRAAVDALEAIEFIDPGKIFLAGYSLGGSVALFTAALDERIAGVAVSSAFSPWRDPDNKDREGARAYADLFGLLPRLGFFTGHEERIPVDLPEITAAIAPRPLLVIAPQLDRHADVGQVTEAIGDIRALYSTMGVADMMKFRNPRELNQFTEGQQDEMVRWLQTVTKSGTE